MKLPWDKKKKSLDLESILSSDLKIDKSMKERREPRYNTILNKMEQDKIDREHQEMIVEIKNSERHFYDESMKICDTVLEITKGRETHRYLIDQIKKDLKEKTKFTGVDFILASQKIGRTDRSPHILDEIAHYKLSMNTNWRQIPKIMEEEMKYEVKSYPDGSKYVKVHTITSNMVFKINTYEDLWILNQIHDVVKNAGLKVEVTIPNLIDAQADRRFKTNQPHGLKLVCEFLNSMTNFSFKIFHPHNAEVVEALLDRVEIIDNSEFINEVLDYKFPKDEDLVILLPDGGAYKWGVKLADKLGFKKDVIAAAKNRQYIDGESKLVQQLPDYDFTNKSVLIIDDLMIGGKTFKGLSKMLKERNCGKLYLAVSHITVEDLGQDPVTNYFDKVFTTNSKYGKYHTEDGTFNRYGDANFTYPENLEIINLF